MVSGPQGSCVSAYVCVCVLSVRIYAKGAAPPVRLQAVDGGTCPPDYAGRNVGLGQGQGSGLLRAPPANVCLAPPPAGCDLPRCPLLPEQKPAGPLTQPLPELMARSHGTASPESLSGNAGPLEPSGEERSLNCRVQAGAALLLGWSRLRRASESGRDSAHRWLRRRALHISQGDNLAFHAAPSHSPLAQLADSCTGS